MIEKIINPYLSGDEKLNIFFVDDDPSLLKLVEVVLGKKFNITCFENPFECLEMIEKKRPDLIVVDFHMSNIDGYELITQIKEHPTSSSIPIVCTSASNLVEERIKMESIGVSGFLKKPYDNTTLSNSIEQILHTLVKDVRSIDEKMRAVIVYNEIEKNKILKVRLKNYLERGDKVIFISWSKGDFHFGDHFSNYIEEEQLIVLEMKSSIITKMPYLNDISPLFDDIANLSHPQKPEDFILVFDNIRNLINHDNRERAYSTFLGMGKIIQTTFKEAEFIMTKFTDPKNKMFLLKLVNVLLNGSH